MERLTTFIFVALPAIVAMGSGVQIIHERATRAKAIEEALEACYDAPDTTNEECEAWADSGHVWPGAQ